LLCWLGFCFLGFQRHDRAGCPSQDLLGDTSHQCTAQAGAAVRRQHNEPGLGLVSNPQNFCDRIAFFQKMFDVYIGIGRLQARNS